MTDDRPGIDEAEEVVERLPSDFFPGAIVKHRPGSSLDFLTPTIDGVSRFGWMPIPEGIAGVGRVFRLHIVCRVGSTVFENVSKNLSTVDG